MTVHEFRRAALGLRDAVEGAHMGHPDFRIQNRIFASLNAEQTVGTVKLTPEEQQQFVARDATVFEPAAGAWGLQGWTKVHLAAADADTVGEALTLAWQGTAAKGKASARRPRATAGATAARTSRASKTRSAGITSNARTSGTASAKSATRAASPARVKAAPKAAKSARSEKKAGAAAKQSAPTPRQVAAAAADSRVIDDYIAQQPSHVQTMLKTVRELVKKEAPKALEKFSYRMPAFEMQGMLIYYAPFKNHLGIFPPVKGDAALEKALAPYRGEKGNLRFPFDRPIPYPLIRRVVRARMQDNLARLASRTSATTRGASASRSTARKRR